MFCSSTCIRAEFSQLTVGESVRNHPQPYPVWFCGFHKKEVSIHSQVSNIVVVICIQFLMPSQNSSTVARYVKSKTPAIHAPKISTCIINTINPSAMKTKKALNSPWPNEHSSCLPASQQLHHRLGSQSPHPSSRGQPSPWPPSGSAPPRPRASTPSARAQRRPHPHAV